jgi:hypothetical protein
LLLTTNVGFLCTIITYNNTCEKENTVKSVT